jgi:hypothetical protein
MSGPAWNKLVHRASAVLGLSLLAAGTLTFLVAGPRAGVAQSLAGTWPATVEFKGSTTERMLPYPVRFKGMGISPHARVTWNIPVVLDGTSEPSGILLERPLFSAELVWDGVSIAQEGNFGAEGAWGSGFHSLLARLPPDAVDPGSHLLQVRVQGAMDMGGALGTIWLGAHSDLNHVYHKLNNRWLFMTILLLTGSIMGMFIVVVRPGIREFFWTSVFTGSLCVYPFMVSSAGWELIHDVSGRMRLIVTAAALSLAASLKMCAHLARRPTDQVTTWAAPVLMGLGVLFLIWPDPSPWSGKVAPGGVVALCWGLVRPPAADRYPGGGAGGHSPPGGRAHPGIWCRVGHRLAACLHLVEPLAGSGSLRVHLLCRGDDGDPFFRCEQSV